MQRTGVPTVPFFLCVHRHGFSMSASKVAVAILSHSCTPPFLPSFLGVRAGSTLNSQLNPPLLEKVVEMTSDG